MEQERSASRKPVSLGEADEAVRTLKRIGRVDIDEYLRQIDDPAKLLTAPLGPTPECLSADRLAEFSEQSLETQVWPHLLECRSCYGALRIFRRMKERALMPESIAAESIVCESPDIDLAGETVRFDLRLLSTVALEDALTLSAPRVFEDLRCTSIQFTHEPLVGLTYVARCEGRPSKAFVESLNGQDIVDWIRVSGSTSAGARFVASDLTRFQVP